MGYVTIAWIAVSFDLLVCFRDMPKNLPCLRVTYKGLSAAHRVTKGDSLGRKGRQDRAGCGFPRP